MRLIDADAMMEEAKYHHEHGFYLLWSFEEVEQLIKSAPTVSAPTVKEDSDEID